MTLIFPNGQKTEMKKLNDGRFGDMKNVKKLRTVKYKLQIYI